jgi:hypothetical protein
MRLEEVQAGRIVKHYHPDGGYFEILGVGHDSELRQRRLVLYRSLRTGEVWVCPATPTDKIHEEEGAFCEETEFKGRLMPRFTLTDAKTTDQIRFDSQGRIVLYGQAGSIATIRYDCHEIGGLLLEGVRPEITLPGVRHH